MNLSTVPPWFATILATRAWYGSSTRLRSSGSNSPVALRKPTSSAKTIVTSLRSSARLESPGRAGARS